MGPAMSPCPSVASPAAGCICLFETCGGRSMEQPLLYARGTALHRITLVEDSAFERLYMCCRKYLLKQPKGTLPFP